MIGISMTSIKNSDKRNRFVTINGDKWLVRILSCREYRKLRGSLDAQAITIYNHRLNQRHIWIRKKYFNFDTVMHEVLHAFMSYKDYSGQSYGRMEENFCEFMPKNVYKVLRVTRTILSF